MSWDHWKIHQCFSETDAAMILKIPLSERRPADKRIWNHTRNGKFSVRSAYHLATTLYSTCGNNLPSTSSDHPSWKQLWGCKLPPKINHFLWRACNDALPTHEALSRRGISIDPSCPSCGLAPETLPHIIFHCPAAVHSWGRSPLRIASQVLSATQFKSFFWDLLSRLPEYGIMIFAIFAWNIWKARNAFIHEKRRQDPALIYSWSMNLVEEIGKNMKRQRNKHKVGTENEPWLNPPAGRLKLNADAGVFSDGTVGLGFVIRNTSGEVQLAGARRCRAPTQNSTIIEALALKFGIQQALRKDLRNLILESDSSNLIQTLRGDLDRDTQTRLITDDIQDLVHELGDTTFSFVRRNANHVAHFLSHFCPNVGDDFLWVKDIPEDCKILVVNDVRREPIIQ